MAGRTYKIKFKKGLKYVSESLPDLPHNAYINKSVTSCGGTTLVLTNKENYIVAVHSIGLIKNKIEQHPNVCGVYGEVSNRYIKKRIKEGCNKFIVTYDSVERLSKLLTDPSQYRLLVDEAQVFIRYLGIFKKDVCTTLLEKSGIFKSVSYMTATPSSRKYLPKPMKDLDYVTFVWDHVKRPIIKQNQINEKDYKTMLFKNLKNRFRDHPDSTHFIFYNSKRGVAATIDNIINDNEFKFRLDDINIFFSNTDDNNRFFMDTVDPNFKMAIPCSETKKRKINFVSSMGFEGVDFYDENVVITIASEPACRSTRYDISIDIPQIIGRFRRCPEAPTYFVWCTHTEQMIMKEREFIDLYKETKSLALKAVSGQNGKNHIIQRGNRMLVIEQEFTYFYMEEDNPDKPIIEVNPYAFESVMSSYQAAKEDYCIPAGMEEDTSAQKSNTASCNNENSKEFLSTWENSGKTPKLVDKMRKLTENGVIIFEENTDEGLNTLTPLDKAKMNKSYNFASLSKRYATLLKMVSLKKEKPAALTQARKEIKEICSACPEINAIHGKLTYQEYVSCKHVRGRALKFYHNTKIKLIIPRSEFEREFKRGEVYSNSRIVRILQCKFNENDLMITATPDMIKNWFIVADDKVKLRDSEEYGPGYLIKY